MEHAGPPEAPLSPRRVLLRVPNWIGDAAMATTVVQAFAEQRPRIELEIVGRGVTPQIFHGLLPAAKCHELGPDCQARSHGRFDLGVTLPDSFSSAWFFFRAGIPVLGRRGDARDLLLSHRMPARTRPPVRHLVEEWDELLAPLGLQPSRHAPAMLLTPEEREAGRQAVAAALGQDRAPVEHRAPATGSPAIVALCPGAAFGAAKRWPAESFAALAAALGRDGVRCVAAGASGEEALVAPVAESCGTLPLLGLPLRTWAAALAACDAVVANDSGAAHVAAACGAPVVTIFGSTDPVWSRPLGSRHRVVSLGLACSPCFERECPLGHLNCLRGVSVARVLEELRAVLGPIPAEGTRP